MELLRGERGMATVLLALLIMFVFMMMLPFMLNFVNLHISRRVAQTGVDAAALAAAEEYAVVLSRGNRSDGYWEAPSCHCYYTPMKWEVDMGEYRRWVDDQQRRTKGPAHEVGERLARANGVDNASLSSPRSAIPYTAAGVRSIFVDVEGDRVFPVLMRAVYGRSEETAPAAARAETYSSEGPDYGRSYDSSKCSCCAWNKQGLCTQWWRRHYYGFEWDIRLRKRY